VFAATAGLANATKGTRIAVSRFIVRSKEAPSLH